MEWELGVYRQGGMDALMNATDDPHILKPMGELLPEMYLTSKELFKYCAWQGEEFDCESRVKSIITPGRVCYTIDNNIEEVTSLKTTIAGEDYGMTILIDIHQEEHIWNVYDDKFDAGVKLLVHSPVKWALTEEKGIALAPGFSHYIGMTYKEVQRLSKPYTVDECVDDELYSFEECITGCSLNLRFQHCNCSDPAACTYLEIANGCYNVDIRNQFLSECQKCKRNCHETIYDVRLSSAMLPAQNSEDMFLDVTGINRTTEGIRKNIMLIKLYFISIIYEETKHKPSFGLETLFANIGGFLGLFVGASVMTILEVVELLGHLIYRCCVKYAVLCRNRRAQNLVA